MKKQDRAVGQVDAILEQLGPLKVYAVVQWTGYALSFLTIAFQLFAIVFVGRLVDYDCDTSADNVTREYVDASTPSNGLPTSGVQERMGIDDVARGPHSAVPVQCPVHVGENRSSLSCLFHYADPKDSSIVSEFDLVCDKAPLLGLTQTLLTVGQGLGSLCLPAFADRWGRKRLLQITHGLTLCASLANGLAPNYPLFAVSKVLIGFGIVGMRLIVTTALLEIVPARLRSSTSVVTGGIVFALCVCLMAPLAYALRLHSWQVLQLVFSSACLLLFLQCLILDEPVRWLLANVDRHQEARRVVLKAGAWNGADLPLLEQCLDDYFNTSESLLSRRDQTLDRTDIKCEDTYEHVKEQTPQTHKPVRDETANGVDNETRERNQEEAILDQTVKIHYSTETVTNSPGVTFPLARKWILLQEARDQYVSGSTDCSDLISNPDCARAATSVHAGDICERRLPIGSGQWTAKASPFRDTRNVDFFNIQEAVIQSAETRTDKPSKLLSPRLGRLSLLDVLRHPFMRVNIIVLCVLWFVNSTTYFGLYLMSGALAGNLYLNFFLNGLVEIPACLVYWLTLERIGRKGTIGLFQVVAGLSLTASGVCLMFRGSTSVYILSTALSLLGKVGATGALNVTIMYTAEVFPTNCRNQSLGAASAAGRLGAMIAPFGLYLAQQVQWAPGVIVGSCCLAAAALLLPLPETTGRELPQTLDDLQKWYDKKETN